MIKPLISPPAHSQPDASLRGQSYRVGVSRPLALVGPVGVAGIVDTYSVLTGKGFPFILEGAGGTVMLPDECTHLWIANKPLPPTRPLPPSQPFFCVSFSFRRLLPYLHSQPLS